QRGARTFVNYCLNCHSAASMRYNRLMDVGLTEQQIKDNLIFTGAKVGDTMASALARKDAKAFFGVEPPDLSVIARAKGADYLYTYLRGFYRDESRPTGWNNVAFPSVGMPHVLWQLQGTPVMKTETVEHEGHKTEHRKLELESRGSLSPMEYDNTVRDLVNYMVFMAEPEATRRTQVGVVVLLALLVLLALTWALKQEYWKDVH
ncbi:MAG TPA: cytochrome c1, partial [Burkholderiales bacterium]|nr:cytochrome c1 [Burkholderiales bacterium]